MSKQLAISAAFCVAAMALNALFLTPVMQPQMTLKQMGATAEAAAPWISELMPNWPAPVLFSR